MSGRFAPSPTGRLHLGNLRTAAVAWLSARSRNAGFLLRVEDLDAHNSSHENEIGQLADLRALGLDWDGDVVRQSERFATYEDAISDLRRRDLVYECYCSWREIRAEIEAAPRAPHLPTGSYPGTCRDLTAAEAARRRADGRPPAVRLRTTGGTHTFHDLAHGTVTAGVDDVVLRRNDGTPAYNLAVVIDDAVQGVDEVVRGDDLLLSTGRQIRLQRLLGLPTPTYGHVPLVVGADGERVAKRHGAVSLEQLHGRGRPPRDVVEWILSSIGFGTGHDVGSDPGPADLRAAVGAFTWARIPLETAMLPAWSAPAGEV